MEKLIVSAFTAIAIFPDRQVLINQWGCIVVHTWIWLRQWQRMLDADNFSNGPTGKKYNRTYDIIFLPTMGGSLPETARTADAAITGSLLHALFSRRHSSARRPAMVSLTIFLLNWRRGCRNGYGVFFFTPCKVKYSQYGSGMFSACWEYAS